MPSFIRTNLIRNRTSATEVLTIDLPTQPISHVLISLSGYNATDETTLAELLAFLNSVTVADMGKTITSLHSEDLYGVNCYLYRRRPHLTQKIATDNATRTLGLVVPFGRRIFDGSECYPARKKGELTLTLDLTALGTSIDNGRLDVDCVQLPDANPTHYLRSRMATLAAPGATGDRDFELPLGAEMVMMQLRMTTFPTTSSHTYGVDKVSVKVDEVEHGYAAADVHGLIADGVFHVDGQSGDIAAAGNILPANQVWLDYDPHGDGQYLLDLKGKSSAKLTLEMGVNEATYLTMLERVSVSG